MGGHLVLRAVAVTFFVLAAYVTVEGIRSLSDDEAPELSLELEVA